MVDDQQIKIQGAKTPTAMTEDFNLLSEQFEFAKRAVMKGRMAATAYAVGDIVNAPFLHDALMRCTVAGTTAGEALSEKSIALGTDLVDGTVTWTVYSKIGTGLAQDGKTCVIRNAGVMAVNGAGPDSSGNVTVTSDVTSVNGQTGDVEVLAGVVSVNGQAPDESGNVDTFLHAIGETWVAFDGQIPAGGVPFVGQLVSRTLWADLFAWVDARGLLKTENEWTVYANAHGGSCPYYGNGDGSTTFRMPKFVGYFKGADSVESVGYTAEGLPNVQATGGWGENGNNPATTGAFYYTGSGNFGSGSTDSDNRNLAFDASRSNPIYGNSEHVTPETNAILVGVYGVGRLSSIGSAALDDVVAAIATLEATANTIWRGYVTAVAKLQNAIFGTPHFTLLAGASDTSGWIGTGTVTLNQSWRDFDALYVVGSDDGKATTWNNLIPTWQLSRHLFEAQSRGIKQILFAEAYNYYWFLNSTTTTDTALYLGSSTENCGMWAIYGLKYEATGLTNLSSVDVSDVSRRIGSMLTDENHLKLPSGLEVW